MAILTKPLVSLILPIFNEEEILANNLEKIYATTLQLKDYYWEIILINDGSTDDTEEIVETFSEKHPNVRVFHHLKNQGLGMALQNGFTMSKGDFVITYDVDLTYSIDYLDVLLSKIIASQAQIVMLSPYMKGGEVRNVPFIRKCLSILANKFLCFIAEEKLSCLTCMVRAYDGRFIRSLSLRSRGKEVMQEIVHKTMITRAEIIEIPAHLDWNEAEERIKSRQTSRFQFLKHVSSTFLRGFLLRPVMFFIIPGLLLFLFSFYPNYWMTVHFLHEYQMIDYGSFFERCSKALEIAYQKHPHTFHTGLISLLMSIQLLALGFQSLQHKHAFEEVFHLLTRLNGRIKG